MYTTTYFDTPLISPEKVRRTAMKASSYQKTLAAVKSSGEVSRSESALSYSADRGVRDLLATLGKKQRQIKHVVVVGIGGSSLGLEAVYAALQPTVALTVLDTISVSALTSCLASLKQIRTKEQLAVCVISKSGNTIETLANASVLLRSLEERFGVGVYERVFFIGDADTAPARYAKKVGAHYFPMPSAIGGRYSVGTEVGLVPMMLLGIDALSFCAGIEGSGDTQSDTVSVTDAARLSLYTSARFAHYNFFVFEKRLERLGAWYRQLFAESIGKTKTRTGKTFSGGMVPTISTAVELHSVGQLYLAGAPGVYTDFVTLADGEEDYRVGPTKLAPALKKLSFEDIRAGLYRGVIEAYQERDLPFRVTIFDEVSAQALGHFMGARMREVMYLAELLDISAFDQPNVELYKQKMRQALKL